MRRDDLKATWPETVRSIAAAWRLDVGPPFPGLTINYAAPAVRADGVTCVLKICQPGVAFDAEVAALTLYDGRGAVRLIEVDQERRAMLLERVVPGTPIRLLGDEESTRIAAQAMPSLWRPVPPQHEFPALSDWGEAFDRHRERFGGGGPLGAELFDYGASLYRRLLAAQGELVVLHGDFHHDNLLLSRERGWLAIDPQGVIGDRAFEPANWLRNPNGIEEWPDLEMVLARRIALFAELLELDAARIRD